MNKKKLFFLILLIIHTPSNTTKITPSHSITHTNAQDLFNATIFDWSRTFAQVMDIAHKKHYKITDPKENMIKAIDGFVSTLDAHSSFLDPKTYKEMLESTAGEFYGVGIVIDNMRKKKDKFLTIVDTIPDGPADKAGVLPMDKIVEINGNILEDITTEKIISQLKGERHSTVKIKVMRENMPDLLSFDIVRDIVKEQHSLSFNIKSHDISYISLSMFTESATKQIEQLLKKAYERHYKGLILDLRNNSGGLLNVAVDIAGLFLKKGSLVTLTKDKNNKELERYVTTKNPIAKHTLPIFVLINNYTASAGEILAGCLKIHSDLSQDYLVFLVGTRTFGKGSVQEIIPVGNDCAVKLTTCLYFLPNNTTVQGVGIEPDFIVERTQPLPEQLKWFTKHYGREEALENYIKIHEKPKDNQPKTPEKKESRTYNRAKEMLQNDNQLKDCITLINMLSSAQKHTPHLVKTRANVLDYLKKNHICETLEIEEIKI